MASLIINNRSTLLHFYNQHAANVILNDLPPFHAKTVTEGLHFDIGVRNRWSGIDEEIEIAFSLTHQKKEIFIFDNKSSQALANYVPVDKNHVINLSAIKAEILKESIADMSEIFPNEICTIFDFTSVLVWMDAKKCGFSGAAFHELPHCTFLSDAIFFAVTPSDILGVEHRKYIVFENIYHESLHHQLSASVSLKCGGYYSDNLIKDRDHYIPSRDKEWSMPNILQAVYVYINVCRTRLIYFIDLLKKIKSDAKLLSSIDRCFIYLQEMFLALFKASSFKEEIKIFINEIHNDFLQLKKLRADL